MNDDSCCKQSCPPAVAGLAQNVKWLNIALLLVILTIVYNLAEAVVALWAGESADSVVLLGFGLDSLIEISAAVMMLWRLIKQAQRQSDEAVEAAEEKVRRFIGITFFALAAYVAFNSATTLWHQTHPQESWVGIILAALSLIIMPLLSWGKMRAAKHINSPALHAEAKETIACSILSLILLVGLGANTAFGWWWADPAAALLMIPWLIKEGLAGIKGEGCC